MITVYVAGSLTTDCFARHGTFDLWQWEQNVRKAEELMLALSLGGFAVICVHTQNRFMFGRIPEAIAIEADLELVRRSDAVALVEGWKRSTGTKGEVEFAEKHGIFVADSPYQGVTRVHDIVHQLQEWSATRVTQPIDVEGPGVPDSLKEE